MSNEIISPRLYPYSGATVYARLRRNTDKQVWKVLAAAYEALDGAHWSLYKIPCTEQGGGTLTGDFYADLPVGVAASEGTYIIDFFQQVGGTPALSDPLIGEQVLEWTTVEVTLAGGVPLVDGAVTDAKFTLPTEVAGTPTGILGLIMWTAAMFGWRKVVKNDNTGTIAQYLPNGTTVRTTSTFTSTGGVDTINKAS